MYRYNLQKKPQHFRVPFPEKGADDPSLLVVQPLPSNVNKWAGEDEDDVMVIIPNALNIHM